MSWHYAVGGQQKGPVSDEVFNQLVKAGTIAAETLVWREGWPDWRAYGTVNAAAADAGAGDPDTAVCAVSGRRLPKSEMFEYEGRWVGVEHKEEFFQRLREGVNLPTEMVYASFGRRVLAKIIDGVIVGVVNAIIGALVGAAVGAAIAAGQSGSAGAKLVLMQVVLQAVGIGLALAYSLFFVRKYDATPGKLAMKMKLVRADGSKLSKGRITGRHFAEWLSSLTLLIGYLMAAFDKEQRRALHDRICDTRVIDVR
jgi:uncharacterized RDD family membrane protein YckC